MTDKILTFEEACRYLRVQKATLYRLAQRKKVPSAKVGGQWRFKKSKIDEWLEKQSEVK